MAPGSDTQMKGRDMWWIDDLAPESQEQVKTVGFTLMAGRVLAGDVSLNVMLTAGMEATYGLPEVFCIGLPHEIAAQIVGQYAYWLSGLKQENGELPPEAFAQTVEFSSHPARGRLANTEAINRMGLKVRTPAVEKCIGREQRFIQLQLSDAKGRMPDEPGYQQDIPQLAWAQTAFCKPSGRALN